ncbi:DNA alkylation repair protein [Sediminibacterium soli]|uniref:DNA alkylation repair protein n=1 Tax=Sediminibacterium soli TaxID=2698829 RepID=UPI00137A4AE1|nr:DNA alkylation repair protein [Sediminibacterium soli]NCI46126.1 DNA alkylation repair protein [Sediminibacterium soli]
MHTYLVPITRAFRQNANAANAAGAEAYLLNQFTFFGLKTPGRRRLCREHYRQYPVSGLTELEAIVRECFALPQREYQYFAIELFAWHKKQWNASVIGLMEECLVTKSWWDSVDHIASEWLNDYFRLYPENIGTVTGKWNRSANIWLQRSSILFQKKFRKDTDTELLTRYILHCSRSKEFFIQKAIGWALREYSKTDPEWVSRFVQQHPLPALSIREAIKRIERE